MRSRDEVEVPVTVEVDERRGAFLSYEDAGVEYVGGGHLNERPGDGGPATRSPLPRRRTVIPRRVRTLRTDRLGTGRWGGQAQAEAAQHERLAGTARTARPCLPAVGTSGRFHSRKGGVRTEDMTRSIVHRVA